MSIDSLPLVNMPELSGSHEIELGWGSVSIEVRSSARRPWLTLLHSLASSRKLWRAQLAALSRDYSLLLIDFRGHGDSSQSPAEFEIADLSSDVVAIWDILNIHRSSVAGISLGGMVGLRLAIDHPDRLDTLTAIGCRASADDAFRTMWEERRRLLATGGMDALVKATLPTWLTEDTLRDRPDIVEEVTELIRTTPPAGYVAATRAIGSFDCGPRLDSITCPVQLLVGVEDGPHPDIMRDMAHCIPQCRFTVIPGGSHLVNLEQAHAVLQSISGFLEEELKLGATTRV